MTRAVVGASVEALLAALREPQPVHADAALVWSAHPCDTSLLEAAGVGALIGTVSPVPMEEAIVSSTTTVVYDTHPALPAVALLPRPCDTLVLFTADAVELLSRDLPHTATSAAALVVELGRRLTRLGYRHVAAPGLALRWSPVADVDGLPPSDHDRALASSANASLAAHQLWAATRLRPMRVVVDGACITDDLYSGTQRVVLEISRALAAQRPSAQVAVAVPAAQVAGTTRAVAGSGVTVVERGDAACGHDVVYRPYQMLRAQELRWCHEAGERLLVSQLDMIGFSNPTYHPSSNLFFLTRNLQRTMMLEADGVTFISEFGRAAALAEVPDLDPSRAAVVSCGSDTEPHAGTRPSMPEGPFVLVLSATLAHKNRAHAIVTFADAARRHGLEGNLVLAGPEPFYGRSTDEEARVLASLGADLAGRIVHIGRATESEKWWLLRHATAVVYPSTVEGFGLIPFEAASVGTPCLSFRGTALGEILGDGPSTIAGWRTADWADALAALVRDPSIAAAALAHVGAAALRHTWAESGRLTWQAIDAAVAMPPRVRTSAEGSFAAAVRPAPRVARLLPARMFLLRLGAFVQRRAARRRS